MVRSACGTVAAALGSMGGAASDVAAALGSTGGATADVSPALGSTGGAAARATTEIGTPGSTEIAPGSGGIPTTEDAASDADAGIPAAVAGAPTSERGARGLAFTVAPKPSISADPAIRRKLKPVNGRHVSTGGGGGGPLTAVRAAAARNDAGIPNGGRALPDARTVRGGGGGIVPFSSNLNLNGYEKKT